MPSEITPEVIQRLVAFGEELDCEMPGVMRHGDWLRDHEHLSFLHWREWVDAAESLPVAAHVALLRALTVAAKCAGWNRGSPSPVIFVYHSVDRRLPFEESLTLATWVQSHVEGHYLPFGAYRLWSAFGDVSPSSVRTWNGTVIALLSSIANGQRRKRQVAQAAIDAALAEQTAARRAEQARDRDRHFARKRTRDSARAELLVEADRLDAVARLALVADRVDLPLPSFPGEWANVSGSDLHSIDEGVKQRLLRRLAGVRLKSWKRLFDELAVDLGDRPRKQVP